MIDEKIAYLKGIYDEENDRQKMAEGKCAQLVSNSGIFLTLIGLLISLLYNTQDVMSVMFKVILLITITIIIVLYLFAMWSALEGLNPFSYNYSRGDPETVNQFTNVSDFKEQILKDYRTSIDINFKLNSIKLERLANARFAFVAGVYSTGALTFGLILYLCFFYIKGEQKPIKVNISSPIYKTELKRIDSTLNHIEKKLNPLSSTQKTTKRNNSIP